MTCPNLLSIYLQPYWVSGIGLLVFFSLDILWNCLFITSGKCCDLSISRVNKLTVTSRSFLIVQTTISIGYFSYCLSNLNDEKNFTYWQEYQELGIKLANSGVPFIWLSCFLFNYSGTPEGRTTFSRFLFLANTLLLIPFFFTHMLPGLFLWIWIVVLLILVLISLICLLMFVNNYLQKQLPDNVDVDVNLLTPPEDPSKPDDDAPTGEWKILYSFFLRVLIGAFVTLTFQTFFNYSVLYYGGEDYIQVIPKEWNLRNNFCYIDNVFTELKWWGSLLTYL